MRSTRNLRQKRSSRVRAAQASMEREIIQCLREGLVVRDCDGNPVTSSNLDTFERLQDDCARNRNGLFGTLDRNPELAKRLLETRPGSKRKHVAFITRDGAA